MSEWQTDLMPHPEFGKLLGIGILFVLLFIAVRETMAWFFKTNELADGVRRVEGMVREIMAEA
jgi:hypothetical protein